MCNKLEPAPIDSNEKPDIGLTRVILDNNKRSSTRFELDIVSNNEVYIDNIQQIS